MKLSSSFVNQMGRLKQTVMVWNDGIVCWSSMFDVTNDDTKSAILKNEQLAMTDYLSAEANKKTQREYEAVIEDRLGDLAEFNELRET